MDVEKDAIGGSENNVGLRVINYAWKYLEALVTAIDGNQMRTYTLWIQNILVVPSDALQGSVK